MSFEVPNMPFNKLIQPATTPNRSKAAGKSARTKMPLETSKSGGVCHEFGEL